MDSKKCNIKSLVWMMVMMLVTALLVSRPATAHLPPGACIDRCMKECKASGIGVASCIKYCPVHCLPPDTTTKDHYCNLGCMLDQCAKYISDEKKMTDCVAKCRKYHFNLCAVVGCFVSNKRGCNKSSSFSIFNVSSPLSL